MARRLVTPGGTAQPANAEGNKRNLMRGGSIDLPGAVRQAVIGQPGDVGDPRARRKCPSGTGAKIERCDERPVTAMPKGAEDRRRRGASQIVLQYTLQQRANQ